MVTALAPLVVALLAAAAADPVLDATSDVEEIVVFGHAPDTALRPPADDPTGSAWTIDLTSSAIPRLPVARLLEEVAGVQVRRLGVGQRATLSLRAAAPNQVLVLYEGIPLNAAHGGADLSLHALDDGASQLTVRRGVDASLHGDGAIGGVVEISARQPAVARYHLGAVAGMGSFREYRAGASGGAGWGSGRADVTFSAREWQGEFPYVDDNGSARVRYNNAGRQAAVTGTMVQRLGPHRVAALTALTWTARGVPGPNQIESSGASQQAASTLAGISARLRDLPLGGADLDARLTLRADALRFDDPAPILGPPVDSRQRLLVARGRAGLTWMLADWQMLTTLVTAGADLLTDVMVDDARRGQAAVALLSDTRLVDDRLALKVRLRADWLGSGQLVATPEAGARLLLWEDGPQRVVEAHVNGGRGWRLPSFYELYVHQDGLMPNPGLRRERADEVDGGLTAELPWARLGVGLFARWLEDMILFVPVSASVIQARNFPSTRAWGLEADMGGGGRLPWRLAYSWTTATYGADGALRLPGVPAHQLTARLGWRALGRQGSWRLPHLVEAQLLVWATAQGQTSFAVDRLGNLREEGRVVFSIGVDLASWWGARCSVRLDNLGDKRDAVDALQYPLPGRAAHLLCGYDWTGGDEEHDDDT